MAKRFSLQTLLEIAQLRVDSDSKRLAVLKQEWQAAEDKLQTLLRSRIDYERRFKSSGGQGMPAGALREYKSFLNRLDQTIAEQRHMVAAKKAAWESNQREWLEQRRKHKAFDILYNRHSARESRLDVHTQQRDHDEFAQTWAGKKPRDAD